MRWKNNKFLYDKPPDVVFWPDFNIWSVDVFIVIWRLHKSMYEDASLFSEATVDISVAIFKAVIWLKRH